jgi:hypothetical protein
VSVNDDANYNSVKGDLFFTYADNILNPKKLTVEQLRSFKGYENTSNRDALEIINGLYELTIITYKIFK